MQKLVQIHLEFVEPLYLALEYIYAILKIFCFN